MITKTTTAKKSLGQNFLIDANYQQKIIKAVLKNNPKQILEIGPGHGALTHHLIDKIDKLILIEKDKNLAASLKNNFDSPKIEIINDDFLKINLDEILKNQKTTVLGNLPYNVSSQIFIRLIENRKYFDHFFLMFQKEVALRLTAKPNTKDYGMLSIWSQVFLEPKILFHLPPSVFRPRPKVTSSFVSLEMKTRALITDLETENFFILMRLLFQKRRKTIIGALKGLHYSTHLISNKNLRAESLSIQELIELWKLIQMSV